MKQKIVIKVQMHSDKCRTKAMKIAAVSNGVSSVAIEGDDKDQVVVTGEGIDSVKLTCLLRKKLGYADIISVGNAKDKDENPDEKPDDIGGFTSSTNTCYQYPPPFTSYYGVVYDPNSAGYCSIL